MPRIFRLSNTINPNLSEIQSLKESGLTKRVSCSLCGSVNGWVCALCLQDAGGNENAPHVYAIDRLVSIKEKLSPLVRKGQGLVLEKVARFNYISVIVPVFRFDN